MATRYTREVLTAQIIVLYKIVCILHYVTVRTRGNVNTYIIIVREHTFTFINMVGNSTYPKCMILRYPQHGVHDTDINWYLSWVYITVIVITNTKLRKVEVHLKT